MKKKLWTNFICSLIILSASLCLCAFTTFRDETGNSNANVVSYRTPIDVTKAGSKWTRSFATTGNTCYNSTPILTEQAIYIVSSNILYELSYDGTIKRQLTLSNKMNSICHMLLEKNFLYIPLSHGIMECVNIYSMTSVWKSNSFEGQSLSTVFYYDGYLYAGSTVVSSLGTTGTYYCLDATDGSTKWTYEDKEHPGGYYWSGGIVHDDVLYFTGDNGILVAHSLLTSEVYHTLSLTDTSKIRAGITYDKDTNALYTASMDGIVYQIVLENKQIKKIRTTPLTLDAKNMVCTSTPTIFQGRIYVGGMADSVGLISVIDANQMKPIYNVKGSKYAEIKSAPLVSTRAGFDDSVYVYVSANSLPGGIYYFVDNKNLTNSKLQTLFLPTTAKQFCLSSITAGPDGTLYYSNDSGTFFAVHELDTKKSNVLPVSKPTAVNKKVTKPKKPTKVRFKVSKKKIKISWKKNTKKSQTIVYVKYGSGHWKKKIIKTKSSYKIVRKKKKTRIRLRSRKKQNGTWRYSTYTKTFLIK